MNKPSIRIELTDEQKRQIEQVTAIKVRTIELKPELLEMRIAPGLATNKVHTGAQDDDDGERAEHPDPVDARARAGDRGGHWTVDRHPGAGPDADVGRG